MSRVSYLRHCNYDSESFAHVNRTNLEYEGERVLVASMLIMAAITIGEEVEPIFQTRLELDTWGGFAACQISIKNTAV